MRKRVYHTSPLLLFAEGESPRYGRIFNPHWNTWLYELRKQFSDVLHFWPFDGLVPADGKSVIVEVYPSLFYHRYLYPAHVEKRDAKDAYAVACCLQEQDAYGSLDIYLRLPTLKPQDIQCAFLRGAVLRNCCSSVIFEKFVVQTVCCHTNDGVQEVTTMHIRRIREAHFQSGIICPRCHSKSTKRNGEFSRTSDRQRYLCKSCGRTFTDLTGTPLAYVKKPNNLWTEVARCMREGMSCRKTAAELGIAVSTVFRWRHNILVALRERFGRYAYKRGKQIHQRGRSREQVPVLVCRDRSARTVSVVMESMKADDVRRHLLPVIDPSSVVCTDGLAVYHRVCKDEDIEHKAFNQSKGDVWMAYTTSKM